MEITNGFYDLCVPYSNDQKRMKSLLTELIELGYRTIAIEQIFDHTKKDLKKSSDIFPAPADIEYLKEYENKLKIFQRLTIIYSDVSVSHAMGNSSNAKKFNIIAGQPKNEAALNHCCATFNCDIVCFDSDDAKPLVNRKTYQVAVKRGICFEIKYSHAITNSNCRKDMIKIAHNYHAKGKSKNIIFSSGAENIFELRGPYDIANLALIFGLSEEQGKSSISSMCRQLCLKAESRRLGKTIMFVKNLGPVIIPSSDESDQSDNDEICSNVVDDSDENSKMSAKEESSDDEILEQPQKRKKLS